jgi:hypothetical protein
MPAFEIKEAKFSTDMERFVLLRLASGGAWRAPTDPLCRIWAANLASDVTV